MDLPRRPTTPHEIIGLVNRKKIIQKIYQALFDDELFEEYVENYTYDKKIDLYEVDIRVSSTQKGFRFSANKFLVCSVENESDIYKLIIPLNKENTELYLYGIISFMEPTLMLEWLEYGFISKSKQTTKETRIHNKFAYSLEKGKKGEKEITPQEYFYRCLLEDAALLFFTEINNGRIKNTSFNPRDLNLLRIWSIMNIECFSQNTIDIVKPTKRILIDKRWERFKSFFDWSINNQLEDSISMRRIDTSSDYSPINCTWVSKVNKNKDIISFSAERYYWHYFDHFYYPTSRIRLTPIIIFGEKTSLIELSAKYKIPGHIIMGRVYSGLKDGDLITPVIKEPATRIYSSITIDGVTKSPKEWSELSGVPVNTIISRLRYEWTGAKLLKPSRRKKVKNDEEDEKI
jgi:hypothetical protein